MPKIKHSAGRTRARPTRAGVAASALRRRAPPEAADDAVAAASAPATRQRRSTASGPAAAAEVADNAAAAASAPAPRQRRSAASGLAAAAAEVADNSAAAASAPAPRQRPSAVSGPAAAAGAAAAEAPLPSGQQFKTMVQDIVRECLQQSAPRPDGGGPVAGSTDYMTGGPIINSVPAYSVSEAPPPLHTQSAALALDQQYGDAPMTVPDESSQGQMVPGVSAEAGDLALTVAPGLRQKIIEHKFIDLGLLLSSTAEPPPSSSTFQVVAGRIQAPAANRQITSFAAWCTAFLRFAGLYLSAHPSDAAGLLMHMRQVSYLHSKGLGYAWREFDILFRRARELAPAQHRWGMMTASSSIWLSAVATGAGPRGPTNYGPSTTARGFQVCYQFNDGSCRRRERCPYQHVCRVCRGPHSQVHCPRRASHQARMLPAQGRQPSAAQPVPRH